MKKNNKNKLNKISRSNTKKRLKLKISKPTLISMILLFITIIVSCIICGFELALFQLIGVILIIGIALLLEKIRKNKTRRRLFNILLIIFFTIAILVCIGIIAFCFYKALF